MTAAHTALLVSGSPRGVSSELLCSLARKCSQTDATQGKGPAPGLIVAIDHGADLLHAAALRPDVLLGDFDSIELSTLAALRAQGVEVIEHDWHKDATDLELAVAKVCERGVTRIVATNVLGGRIDHELAALGVLVAAAEAGSAVRIVEDDEVIHVLAAGSPYCELSFAGMLDAASLSPLSLIPWGGEALVSAQGFEWPLDRAILAPGSSLGISNIAVSAMSRVDVHRGALLVVQNTALRRANH